MGFATERAKGQEEVSFRALCEGRSSWFPSPQVLRNGHRLVPYTRRLDPDTTARGYDFGRTVKEGGFILRVFAETRSMNRDWQLFVVINPYLDGRRGAILKEIDASWGPVPDATRESWDFSSLARAIGGPSHTYYFDFDPRKLQPFRATP